jgi:lipopolysaccharide export LptBFGC system permease protein LptF
VSRRASAAAIVLALLCSGASLGTLAWVSPATNQAFRVTVVGREDVRRGLNELTMAELTSGPPPDTLAASLNARQLALAYHGRWSLAFAPAALTLFALALRTRGRIAATGLAVVSCAVYLGYFSALPAAPDVAGEWWPPAVAAWLPNVVLVALALSSVARGRQT